MKRGGWDGEEVNLYSRKKARPRVREAISATKPKWEAADPDTNAPPCKYNITGLCSTVKEKKRRKRGISLQSIDSL